MSRRITVYRLTFTLLLGLISLATLAQDIISGTVLDEENTPLPGVSIIIKGTTNGTITDLDGNFTVNVPEGSEFLIFSFIGFQSQEVNVLGRSTVNITMTMDITQLDEIVVVGYGTQDKKDVTGAMASITPKDFNPGVVSNPAELMQGRIAGVQITPSSGEPGAAININIRGIGSIRSGNDPLFVIDGVPIGGGNVSPGGTDVGDIGGSPAKNPLNFLNPDDIESIDILKDASATAIYGSRGANGVILITTKKGKSGESGISYSGYVGVSSVREKIDVLSAADYRRARLQLAAQTGNTAYADYDFGASTDWQDEIFRTALSQNHSVSFNGGSEKSSYRASIAYQDQEGIIETSEMKKVTGRINLNQALLNDRLKMGMNLTASNVQDRSVPIGDGGGFLGDALGNALRANPTMPILTDSGTYFQFSNADRNPVAMINLMDDRTTTDRLLGNVTADLELFKGLHLNLNVGYDKTISNRSTNLSNQLIYITPTGWAGIQYNERKSRIMESFLNYTKSFGEHEINAMAGYSYQGFETTWHSMIGQGYSSNEILPTDNIGGSSGLIPPQIFSGGPISELQSYFGRVNYSYADKYLLTTSLRFDGSSKFGPNNKYGTFPSMALGWRIIEEGFLKDQNFIYDLKLRVGWGQTGNQEIPDNLYQPVFSRTPAGVIQIVRDANPDIKWETTIQSNVGVDFGFWDGRISGTMDYFRKSTTDLLMEVALGGVPLTETGWKNLDVDVINTGIEATVTSIWITGNDFEWSSTVNFTRIENTVENYGQINYTGVLNGQGLTGVTTQVVEEGHPLQTFYLRKFLGYDSEGLSQYEDADGNPVDGNEAAFFHIGSGFPDYAFSINNSLRYKAFDFTLFVDSKQGQYVYNNTANTYFNKSSLAQAKNITYDELYSPRNIDDVVMPSTKYLEDASFIRISAVTLGWTLPDNAIKGVKSARVYLTGQNLHVFTDYTGYDPEVNTNKSVGGIPSFGIDYTSYPKPRTILLGLSVGF